MRKKSDDVISLKIFLFAIIAAIDERKLLLKYMYYAIHLSL